MSVGLFVFAGITMFVGASIQSVVGFGMNLFAVPVLLLGHANQLVPGPLIVVLFAMSLMLGVGEFARVDWTLLRWFLPARVIGTFAGSVVAAQVSNDAAVVIICSLILIAVVLSMKGWRVALNPRTWMASGAASGFSNVLSSIGGPPLALVMVDHEPSAQRSTQGWSGLIGSALSMGFLAAQHKFGVTQMRDGALLIVPALLGAFAAVPLRPRLADAERLRPYVYATAGLGAIAVIGRTVLL